MSLNRTLVKLYKEHNLGEASLPVAIHHTAGNYIYDAENNAYLDFTSGYGVTSSGWSQTAIKEALKDQLEKLFFSPPWLATEEAIELSRLLLSISPLNITHCHRATGGGEANELILKSLLAGNPGKKIISFKRSYHGGTLATLALGDGDAFSFPVVNTGLKVIKAEPPYCYRCPFGKKPQSCHRECALQFENIFEEHPDVTAVIAEPVLGSGGVIVPRPDYYTIVAEICRHYNVKLIFDEVLTGFGRLGAITAASIYDVEPDAISFAKGMGGGLVPVGAALFSDELAENCSGYEDVTATFAWTPLACAVAVSNIHHLLTNDYCRNADVLGNKLKSGLSELFQKYLPAQTGEVRGMGLMLGVEMVEDQHSKQPDTTMVKKLIMSLLRKGLMVCSSWDFSVLVFLPPLSLTESEMNEGLDLIESVLKEFSTRIKISTSSKMLSEILAKPG